MELKEKIDSLNTLFVEFKKTNDARLAEIEAKGKASVMTEEKAAKLEAGMQKLEVEIEAMTKALGRTGHGQEQDPEKLASLEAKKGHEKYAQEFKNFMRSGAAISQESREFFRKTMSVDSDQDGGFLVSPEMSSEIVTKVYESSPMRELASVQTISTDSLDMIQDLDEAGSGWVGETESRAVTSTPTIKEIKIPVHELYALPKATQKLLDDAAVNVEAWLAAKVSEKFARDEATAFISGNGNNKPKGITAYASGTSFGQIERKTAASATAVTADELIDLQAMLKEPYQANATWLMNRLIIATVRKLKDSQNNYLWQPSLQVGQPGTLLGRPVRMASDLPSSLSTAADTMIYGDFRMGYQIVDRVGIRVLRDPFTAKPHVLFYTTKRVGGGVKNFEALKVMRQA